MSRSDRKDPLASGGWGSRPRADRQCRPVAAQRGRKRRPGGRLSRPVVTITLRGARSAARSRCGGRCLSRRPRSGVPTAVPHMTHAFPVVNNDMPPRGGRGHIGFWWRRRRHDWRRERRGRGRGRFRLLSAGGQSDCRRNRQNNCYASSPEHSRLPKLLSGEVDNRDQLAPPSRVL